MITNTFAAEQLTGYVPFLTNYDFTGNMKLFANFQGKYEGPEPLQKMYHITLQKGQILRQGTKLGLHDVDLDFDLGPMLMESQSFQFTLGGAAFKGKLKGLHPGKNPEWGGQIESAKAIPSTVWKEGLTLWSGTDAAAQQTWQQSLHPLVQNMILSNETVENVAAQFSVKDQVIKMNSLKLGVFDGSFLGSAEFQPTDHGRKIESKMIGKDMDSVRFFKFWGAAQPGIEGKVDWTADVKGERASLGSRMELEGPVSLSIRNGALTRFNFVRALEQMEWLKKADQPSSDRTPFDVLDVSGELDGRRYKIEQLTLKNSEIQVEGQGEMNEGTLNLRMKTRLESGYFRQLFPDRAGDFISDGDAFFGPVTLLATGHLDDLNLKPDPQSVAELAKQFARRKSQSLSRFL